MESRLALPWDPNHGVLDTQLHLQPQGLAGLRGALRTRSVPSGGQDVPNCCSLTPPGRPIPFCGDPLPCPLTGAGADPGCGGLGGREAEPRGEGAKQPVTALTSGSLSLTWAGFPPRSLGTILFSHAHLSPAPGPLTGAFLSARILLPPVLQLLPKMFSSKASAYSWDQGEPSSG